MLSRVPVLLKVVTPEKVTVELLAAVIVPALVRVVMLDNVAVVGRVIVAPELLVRVVGLKDKVPPDAKVMAPELVNVPPVTVKVEVVWKLIVSLELFVNPVLVSVVRAGKLRVVPLLVNVVIPEIVVTPGAVIVPLLVIVPKLEMVVPETFKVPLLVIDAVEFPVKVVAAVNEPPLGMIY